MNVQSILESTYQMTSATRFARGLAIASVIVVFAADVPHASAQGILQRIRSRVQQFTPQPAPQTRPQTNPSQRVPTQVYRVQPPASRIDPRTGRPIANSSSAQKIVVDSRTGQPITLGDARNDSDKFDPSAPFLGVVIDPRSGQKVVIDTRTRRIVSVNPADIQAVASHQATTSSDKTSPNKSKVDAGDSILNNAPQRNDLSNLRPTLGLQVVEKRSGIPALEVVSFQDHSRAKEAGLRAGDKIYSLNGQPTPTIDALHGLLDDLQTGQQAKLRIGRGIRVMDLSVPLVAESQTAPPAASQLGVPNSAAKPSTAAAASRVAPMTASPNRSRSASVRTQPLAVDPSPKPKRPDSSERVQLGVEVEDRPGTRGAVIVGVDPDSPASRAGMKVGDRIVSLDGRMVANTDSLIREFSTRRDGETVAVQLVRSNRLVASNVSLANASPSGAAGATESGIAAQAPEASKSDPSAGGSVLGGVGSMIGGLFGSKPSSKNPAVADSANENPSAKSEPNTSSTNKPATVPPTTPQAANQPTPATVVPASGVSNSDEMAFGDAEPIEQTIFESSVLDIPIPEPDFDDAPQRSEKKPVDAPSPTPAAKTDPPSVIKLEPPKQNEPSKIKPAKTPATQAEKKISELEAEIERLRQQLEDAKSDD
ncbi:MAG: PDZ domain-containing protein [Pirellulaceae bacterium]|nr:PDZ domain-containing protein [Pirellulaceae bacterium]